jgi:hypothetical protein
MDEGSKLCTWETDGTDSGLCKVARFGGVETSSFATRLLV